MQSEKEIRILALQLPVPVLFELFTQSCRFVLLWTLFEVRDLEFLAIVTQEEIPRPGEGDFGKEIGRIVLIGSVDLFVHSTGSDQFQPKLLQHLKKGKSKVTYLD
jgi:hypothetical protein